ncbi:PREDICTED: uncharacterized protein LOC106340463 isoform X1 [Brassica oleracea var. oleracea]|uniref:uncharacterized protein LOC106340463 isoform X1 n=1 Tax=Brassica oleracea var. oleracea TaxID=109376 RepID=UPI0006A6E3FB|nr:PREDICTED: uncharacterized protein LOC106340463 isoform X1 [Brassica oleracea var. oleracea]
MATASVIYDSVNFSYFFFDFDDDDINVHFSQDEISRVGACCIVNVKNQYVRPSNEDPLQALIQDTFLDKAESSLLLFSYVSHTICFQRRAVECPAILETRISLRTMGWLIHTQSFMVQVLQETCFLFLVVSSRFSFGVFLFIWI